MKNIETKPALRPLEAFPVDNDGQRMVALYDPAGHAKSTLTLSLPAFNLVTLMDGLRDMDQILAEFSRRFNGSVPRNETVKLISALDDAYMLDSVRFRSYRKTLRDQFFALSARPSALAGQSYPADSEELTKTLDRLLDGKRTENANNVRAIITPHIDFRIGSDMMADGWREIKDTDADLFIILGIGHSLIDDFFACIDKDFETPVGTMRVDTLFLRELAQNFGEDIYGSMEAHKNEHSIEFASLFMARLFGARPEVSAVPILLSFPEEVWDFDHPVFNGDRVNRFIEAIGKTARESGRKIVYVASVDFCHVGARFGDKGKLTNADYDRIEKDDKELIETISQMDTKKFLDKIIETNATNRVCGFPALYTLLNVCDANSGGFIGYRQNVEGDDENVVSFATMILRA